MATPTKKTSSISVDLNIEENWSINELTLTGNNTTGTAQTPDRDLGDTLLAAGNNITLQGGAGLDSLVAQGTGTYLIAGTGNNTLVGTSLSGGQETLVGNGKSTLRGGRANNTYVITKSGDKITDDTSGVDTVLSSLALFSLSESSVAGGNKIENLTYTGLLSSSLIGNSLANSISEDPEMTPTSLTLISMSLWKAVPVAPSMSFAPQRTIPSRTMSKT